MMKRSTTTLFLIALAGLGACDEPASVPAQQQANTTPATTPSELAENATAATVPTDELSEPADPRFIGRVWVSTTPGSARGSILVFLPDRTLLMDSCFETFRLSKWGVAGDHIRWIEDAIPIEAEVSLPSNNELRLRIAGQDVVQSYVTATVPYVCPDMPR